MTIQEMDKLYPVIWIVSYATITMYHNAERLFLTESEAQSFYDSLKGIEDKHIGRVHDIWGFSKKHHK